ncbi:hypothetical protein [Holospora elegans]|uniref:hypothetical protein n=1 Tax=Holospora elegans TaxID=431043 RepID=UPI00055306AD|nr:hypothetical protein [Holospora elegans]
MLSFSAPLLEEINFCRNEGLSVSLEDAEKLKKQFPLLKKIVILRTINENNWVYITFQEKAVFSNKE